MDNITIDEYSKNTFSRKFPIVKGNQLMQAKIDEITLIEYKLLIASISRITPSDKVLDYISFSVMEFCDLLKVQPDGMYNHLQKACDKLIQRIITVEKNNGWIKFSWLHKIEYKNGCIKLKFHEDLEPYLLFCVENKTYTKYLLENVIDMNSKYAIRLYEILKQYKSGNIPTRTFELSELKELLGIPKVKYQKYDNFRRKVLMIGEREINGLSDINISYEKIRKNKQIKIKFYIRNKKYNINELSHYNLIPKLKLITILRTKILNIAGTIVDVRFLNSYHRIILIELINKFESGIFNKVIIQHPKAFFEWHLEQINNSLNIENKKDF